MTTVCLTRLVLAVLGMLLGASGAFASDSFPWTDESAAAVGEYLAIREVAEAPGPGSSGLAALASSVKPASAMGVSVAAAGSGLPIPAFATFYLPPPPPSSSSLMPRRDEAIILEPRSTSARVTVNSPKPFKLAEPYGTAFAIGPPTVKVINATGYLGDGFSHFAKGVSLTSAGLKGLSIGTDLVNVSRSNDPYYLGKLVGDSIELLTELPGGKLADLGNAMRTQMIDQRNSMVIDKLAGPGAMRGILENRLDHPTRLSSEHLLRATTFSQYNDGFTRKERQMEFAQFRADTYGRFDYFHAREPIQTTIVTRQFETIRTWQGWSSVGNLNLMFPLTNVEAGIGAWRTGIGGNPGYQMMPIQTYRMPIFQSYQVMRIPSYQMPRQSYQTPIVPSLTRTK